MKWSNQLFLNYSIAQLKYPASEYSYRTRVVSQHRRQKLRFGALIMVNLSQLNTRALLVLYLVSSDITLLILNQSWPVLFPSFHRHGLNTSVLRSRRTTGMRAVISRPRLVNTILTGSFLKLKSEDLRKCWRFHSCASFSLLKQKKTHVNGFLFKQWAVPTQSELFNTLYNCFYYNREAAFGARQGIWDIRIDWDH